MAEKCENSPNESSQQEEKSSGNWWDTWISSAKTKSAEVYSMVKKDLDEIGTAVKCEASHVFSSTSSALGKTFKLDVPESPANVMKKSFSTFIGQVSTVLNPEPDDEDDTEVILSSGDTTMLSTYKKELEALQRVDATYIVPAYSPEFEAWRTSLETSEAGIITPASAIKRLEANPILKAQYNKLVPDAVTHEEFWERYLFRVALLQDRLAAASRKQPMEQPSADPVLAHLPLQAPIEQSPKKVLSGLEIPYENDADEVVTWEDDFAHDVELTEEQQILLLEEYEKEITSKKINKRSSSRDLINNNADTPTKPSLRDELNNTTIDKKNKNGRSTKKAGKPDECGNNLVEDYFGDKDQVKDDASANSDESWEKEFEIEEPLSQKL
ncbi:BSD domain-containing protein 1-like isoform X2 [Battus philenor]|uniref:BSD domain-containing protein 1-like isoform X2 n=1 Tax=Battus philenor TaxID=42288 RepID=UPI0035CEE306